MKTAQLAALEAGKKILKYYKSNYDITEKSYHNPVTDADHAADARIKEIIMNQFPDYGWLSEETADTDARLSREYVWIIDPLDGTKEFIEGVDNFVVSIALIKNAEPILGVLFNPVTEELFHAEKGSGAWYNGKQIHCSSKIISQECEIVVSRSETRRGLWDNTDEWFNSKAHIGSVAYKLGLTGLAKYDCFATLRPKNEWDVAAGDIIIRESGGTLCNLETGEPIIYNRANPLIVPGLVGGNSTLVENIREPLFNQIKELKCKHT